MNLKIVEKEEMPRIVRVLQKRLEKKGDMGVSILGKFHSSKKVKISATFQSVGIVERSLGKYVIIIYAGGHSYPIHCGDLISIGRKSITVFTVSGVCPVMIRFK